MTAMLQVKDLHASVNGVEILKGVDLTVRPGEVHAIMGPNGSGKSTLAQVLAGRESYEVTRGQVLYQGKDLLALDEALRNLEREEPRKAAVVKLRFFAGLTNEEAAEALGVSPATAENDWAYARAWLRVELGGGPDRRG